MPQELESASAWTAAQLQSSTARMQVDRVALQDGRMEVDILALVDGSAVQRVT